MTKNHNWQGWTKEHVLKLHKAGTIRLDESQLEKLRETRKISGNKFETGIIIGKPSIYRTSKEKTSIEFNLFDWTQGKGLVLHSEYYFHPERRWRFDYCIKDLMIAIEYNGIMSEKSRHTTITGYSGDMKKLNAAMGLGYTVFQFTPLNYNDLTTTLNNWYINFNCIKKLRLWNGDKNSE